MTTRVKDVMTRTPYTIDPEAPIETATAVMTWDAVTTEQDALVPVLGIDPDTYLW